MFIQTETTPNEHALKFKPGRAISPSSTQVYEYTSYASTVSSPLARKLFTAVPGVTSVFFGPDFVSVTKSAESRWATMKPDIYAILMDHLTADLPVVLAEEELERVNRELESVSDGGMPEVAMMIRELLDSRIRPAIQEDGGDVEFMGLTAEGVVQLKLKGSCRGCSSSSVTLKSGIENMLKHYIPEVSAVEQVLDETDRVANEEFEKLESKLSAAKKSDK